MPVTEGNHEVRLLTDIAKDWSSAGTAEGEDINKMPALVLKRTNIPK